MNESYYRYAEKHNKYLQKEFAEIKTIVKTIGAMILQHSGLPPDSLPLVPRDKKYFLMAGFNLQIKSWALYFNYRKHTQRNPFPHLEYWY